MPEGKKASVASLPRPCLIGIILHTTPEYFEVVTNQNKKKLQKFTQSDKKTTLQNFTSYLYVPVIRKKTALRKLMSLHSVQRFMFNQTTILSIFSNFSLKTFPNLPIPCTHHRQRNAHTLRLSRLDARSNSSCSSPISVPSPHLSMTRPKGIIISLTSSL